MLTSLLARATPLLGFFFLALSLETFSLQKRLALREAFPLTPVRGVRPSPWDAFVLKQQRFEFALLSLVAWLHRLAGRLLLLLEARTCSRFVLALRHRFWDVPLLLLLFVLSFLLLPALTSLCECFRS